MYTQLLLLFLHLCTYQNILLHPVIYNLKLAKLLRLSKFGYEKSKSDLANALLLKVVLAEKKSKTTLLTRLKIMVIQVVEFSNEGYKIRKIFA